jgi:RNA recognition motif-containing protein
MKLSKNKSFIHQSELMSKPEKGEKTIHIGNLSSSITEDMLISYFKYCGQITNVKLGGSPDFPARFGFLEFSTEEQAKFACQFSGQEIAGKQIKISLSKTPISQPYTPNKFTSFPQMYFPITQDVIHRTIYVSGIDSSMTEQNVVDYFSYCGQITNYKFCGDTSKPTRFAFFEYATFEGCITSMRMNGNMLGSSVIR